MPALSFARRRRNNLIDALALDEVIRRLRLFGDSEDVLALETIARNVLKRRLDEQDDALRLKTMRPHRPAFAR